MKCPFFNDHLFNQLAHFKLKTALLRKLCKRVWWIPARRLMYINIWFDKTKWENFISSRLIMQVFLANYHFFDIGEFVLSGRQLRIGLFQSSSLGLNITIDLKELDNVYDPWAETSCSTRFGTDEFRIKFFVLGLIKRKTNYLRI